MRIDRHETLCGLETKSGAKEAEYAIRKANEFLKAAKETLRQMR
jgi:uncharacterized protein (UPF0332 family)